MYLDTVKADCEWVCHTKGYKHKRPRYMYKMPYILKGERLLMTAYLGVVVAMNDGRFKWTRLQIKWGIPQQWANGPHTQGCCATLEEAKLHVEAGFESGLSPDLQYTGREDVLYP